MFVYSVFYVGLTAGETLADRGYAPPGLAMFSPNIILGTIALVGLLRRASRWRHLARRRVPRPAAALPPAPVAAVPANAAAADALAPARPLRVPHLAPPLPAHDPRLPGRRDPHRPHRQPQEAAGSRHSPERDRAGIRIPAAREDVRDHPGGGAGRDRVHRRQPRPPLGADGRQGGRHQLPSLRAADLRGGAAGGGTLSCPRGARARHDRAEGADPRRARRLAGTALQLRLSRRARLGLHGALARLEDPPAHRRRADAAGHRGRLSLARHHRGQRHLGQHRLAPLEWIEPRHRERRRPDQLQVPVDAAPEHDRAAVGPARRAPAAGGDALRRAGPVHRGGGALRLRRGQGARRCAR